MLWVAIGAAGASVQPVLAARVPGPRGTAPLAKVVPELRLYHRAGFFTCGHRATWEYPRETPSGEQMDFVEVMEIEDGLIHAPGLLGLARCRRPDQ